MNAALNVLKVIVVLIAFVCWLTFPITNAGRCYEDMACWNCETMGNRICGEGY